MSEQADIKQKITHAEYAATAATGSATIYVHNYYYGEDVRVTPVKPEETAAEEKLPCPYRGLFHFSPKDAEFFFGRDIFVEKLFQATQTRNFIPVLGASGSGKSSVVLAGLVPKLQEKGRWKFTHFRPGLIRKKERISIVDPFYALATALVPLYTPQLDETKQLAQASELADFLRNGKVLLSDVIADIQKNYPNHRVLLIADQFEELYSVCREEKLRCHFLDILIDNIYSPISPSPSSLVLVLTMRADFLGSALSYRPFADVLQNADIKLGAMNRSELSQVIEKPAEKLGVSFEAGLVKRILGDVEDEPGNLPLLEFALTELWQKRTGKQLTHEAYELIGQVKGALADYADKKYGNLTSAEQEQARRIFIQLIRPGEGTEDTRRLTKKDELRTESWSLVQKLANARLVVTGRREKIVEKQGQDPEAETPRIEAEETVEIVHEALIQNWGRLRQWMKTDRDFRAWQERLRTAMNQWEDTKQDQGALLRGAPLTVAEEWQQQRNSELSQAEQDFIKFSLIERAHEKQERERQEREKLEAQVDLETATEKNRILAKAQKTAKLQLKISSIISVIILIVSGITVVIAYQNLAAKNEEIERAEIKLQNAETNLETIEDLLAEELIYVIMTKLFIIMRRV